jgi:hypothetical protein
MTLIAYVAPPKKEISCLGKLDVLSEGLEVSLGA